MSEWKKTFWRSEFQLLIKECLKTGDLTIQELIIAIQNTAKIQIHYAALASILKVTDGVIVKTKKYSKMSQKIINVYSLIPRTEKE